MEQRKLDGALENFAERVRLAAEAFHEEVENERVLQIVGTVVVLAKDDETFHKGDETGVLRHLTDGLWATLEHAELGVQRDTGLEPDDFCITLE